MPACADSSAFVFSVNFVCDQWPKDLVITWVVVVCCQRPKNLVITRVVFVCCQRPKNYSSCCCCWIFHLIYALSNSTTVLTPIHSIFHSIYLSIHLAVFLSVNLSIDLFRSLNINVVGLKSIHQTLALFCTQLTSVSTQNRWEQVLLGSHSSIPNLLPLWLILSQLVFDIIACNTYLDCMTFHPFELYFLR